MPGKTVVLILVAAFAAYPSWAEDAADLVLRRGTFYPVQPPGAVEGSLAVRGGRIVFLGPDAAVERWIGPDTEVVELGGRAVTPGLIDAHSHLASLGDALAQVDLVGTASYAEVIERVRRAAAAAAPGEWVLGHGWDQNDWPDSRFPSHQELSRAVPDHPVWLSRIDGHAALVNARGMEKLGIDSRLADPPGGRLLRDEQGEPTGVLIDNAMDRAFGLIPPPPPEVAEQRLLAAARHCLERGLTTVTDMGVGERELAVYHRLRESDRLPLRAALFLAADPHLLAGWMLFGPEIDSESRLLVRGVKLYADGALGSRGAALIEPYDDDPANLGLLVSSGDHLAQVAGEALASGFQVGVHAIGDRGSLVAIDALERALGGPRPEVRWRLEHAQVMRLQDIERMARLGLIASMQPTHATSDMPWAAARVGERRLAGAYAWRKVLDAGGRLALGSDFPVESADPRLGLYAAVTRQDLAGNPAGGWRPEERLTIAEALSGFTLDAAYSLFLEHEVGSLELGKRADLVVFDRDLVRGPASEIPRAQVDLTLVDGRVVYRREGS